MFLMVCLVEDHHVVRRGDEELLVADQDRVGGDDDVGAGRLVP